MHPYARDLAASRPPARHTRAPVPPVRLAASRRSSGTDGWIRSSPSSTANGSPPTCGLGDRRPRAPGRAARAAARSGSWPASRQLADLPQLVELALGLQQRLELQGPVEVVLDRALATAGDDEDVGQAGAHRLLDHELDRGRVDDAAASPWASALVAGRNRVPRPAAGITALLTLRCASSTGSRVYARATTGEVVRSG